VLAKTMKGYAMGEAAQGRMTTHQAKKLDSAGLLAFRDRFALPMSDADTQSLAFYKPADDSAEMRYLMSRRRALGGSLPARRSDCAPVPVPSLDATSAFALQADGKEMSTTMAFVRVLGNLLKDPALGPRVVPIVADEARTFGMASLFRQVGIYAPLGQLYQPEDSGSILSYREDKSGQILEEGITEAGALSSWTGGGDVVLDARPGDAAVLHLLLDVRLPARRRPDLGRRRPARARLPHRRDRRPDDALGRRPAAPGRHEPPRRRDRAQLQGLRPGDRRRARRHRRPRHARDARGAEATSSTT
jgi:pyruvate dehydrogenase E1 component